MRTRSTRYPVPALEKGLDILEHISATAAPPALGELAAALGRSSSELFRMLDCLERRGYIRKEASGGYVLTLKLYELAHLHSPVDHLLRAAQEPMRELAQEIRHSCHVSMLDDDRLIVLGQELSPEPARLSIEVGARFPILRTASGRLLLAHMDDGAREALLVRQREYRMWSAPAKAALQQELRGILRSGVSEAVDESIVGVRDAAFVIGNPQVGWSAALAVAALVPRGQIRDWRRHHGRIRACAEYITHRLGLKTPPRMSRPGDSPPT